MRAPVGAVVAVILIVSGCGGAPSGGASVEVLLAGSLQNVIETTLAPAFEHIPGGATVHALAEGSQALANAIKGRLQSADVFLSAAPSVDASLEGRANGDWVSWYVTFARTELVVGYNPTDRFAHDFQTMPWYRVLALPGIRVGRTDPTTDPKGVLTLSALSAAATAYHDPGLAAAVLAHTSVFPEEELVGRLQAGQLDAGFFYTAESVPAHLATASLGRVLEVAPYTLTILNRAPHPGAAAAFVRYLLGPARATLRADGIQPVTPRLSGPVQAVPASLRSLV